MAHDLPIIRLPGLPDFNTPGQSVLTIEDLSNWWSAAPPSPVLVANGGAAGQVATGLWLATEEYLTLSGFAYVPPEEQESWRRALLKAMPAEAEVPLTYVGNGWDTDKVMFVRRYDRPTLTKGEFSLYFSFPLVAPDPFKYGLTAQAGVAGVFTGEQWFYNYAVGTPSTRVYGPWSPPWSHDYQQAVPTGVYPVSLLLSSGGDVSSQRLTATVTGPLGLGDWWLTNESTGARLWAAVAITAGQSLIFDTRAKTALLNGSDVSHLVYGDWLTLEPGGNTYRLTSGTQSAAYVSISALEAFQ